LQHGRQHLAFAETPDGESQIVNFRAKAVTSMHLRRAEMLLLKVYLLLCAVGTAESYGLRNLLKRSDTRALQATPTYGQLTTVWSRSANPAKFAPLRHGAATGIADDALVVFGGLDVNSR
jgi:hypothetical protein